MEFVIVNRLVSVLINNVPSGSGVTSHCNYLIGGIIAFLILVYLVYSLVKPEKF